MSVFVQVSAPSISLENEIHFPNGTKMATVRQRVYAMTGFSPESMKILISDNVITDDAAQIDSFACNGHVTLVVTGKSEFGDLNDVSAVPKFEISDEDYDGRKGTLRELKRKMGIPVKGEVVTPEEEPTGINVGERCEATLLDRTHQRGVIKFIGKTKELKGYMVGIQLDDPVGTNDGSIKGSRYFECQEKYGVFVKPSKVKAGDYPPIDWEKELGDEL